MPLGIVHQGILAVTPLAVAMGHKILSECHLRVCDYGIMNECLDKIVEKESNIQTFKRSRALILVYG